MANINISQLPNLSPLTANSVLPVDSGGSTYHVTAANLATYVNSNASAISVTGNIDAGGNITVGAGGDFTQQLTVDGTIHAVFDNLYEQGGEITADKNVYVGRLTVSDQPNDLPIPGITTGNTALDFSLGSPSDTGNIYISRTIIRDGLTGVADIIPGKTTDPSIGVNTPTLVYTVSDPTIIALELRINYQYGTINDSDTELAAIYVTKNQGGTANVAVGTVSSTSVSIPPATYTANVNGSGLLQVYATTDATASSAFYRFRAVEFGGFFGV